MHFDEKKLILPKFSSRGSQFGKPDHRAEEISYKIYVHGKILSPLPKEEQCSE